MSRRASTPAGRQRATQRTRGGAATKRTAKGSVKPATKRAPAKTTGKTTKGKAKVAPKRAPAKKAAPKRTATAKGTTTKKAAPRRTAARRLPAKPAKARAAGSWRRRPSLRGFLAALVRPRNIIFAVLLVVALGAGYRFWLRDSSLVAVDTVKVTGAQGPEAAAVTKALKRSGDGMSTLDADQAAIEKSVAAFPTVAGVSVDTDFPHGMTVTVDSRPPVMIIDTGSKETPVAGDGTILTGVDEGNTKLPVVQLSTSPTGGRVTGDALSESIVLGGAPGPLQPLIDKVRFKQDQGVVVTLAGLPVIFGTADRVDEKWTAVSTTLADPSLESLSYLDVRVPERPAAGGAGETLADAPDPASTVVPTDIVPATTETTTPVDPAVTPTDTGAVAPAATDSAAAATETPASTETPAATETVTPPADGGGEITGGGVAP